mgnify:CR=1 FL=1
MISLDDLQLFGSTWRTKQSSDGSHLVRKEKYLAPLLSNDVDRYPVGFDLFFIGPQIRKRIKTVQYLYKEALKKNEKRGRKKTEKISLSTIPNDDEKDKLFIKQRQI